MQEQIDRTDAWSLDAALDRAMDALRVPDGDRDVTTLSGGERRRVALCRLLLSSPDLLLLDEPTNHLDAESVAWLERFLADYAGTVVAVTHDRYFLDNVAGWILELDRGRGIPYKGNYSGWLEQKQVRLASEEKQESARRRALARELEWVRSSPKARHDKSKARLAAYERLLAEERDVKLDRVEIHIPAGPRLGDVVVDVHVGALVAALAAEHAAGPADAAEQQREVGVGAHHRLVLRARPDDALLEQDRRLLGPAQQRGGPAHLRGRHAGDRARCSRACTWPARRWP